ncbi:MAG: flagellar hook-basal body protein [Candidatus Eisenbacteria bacterium]
MVRGILVSGAAMRPAMQAQSVLANNLANATSTGFRQDRIAFEQTFFQGGEAPSLEGTAAPRLLTSIDARPGPYEVTDRRLDLAIQGEGYFVVEAPEGERYTRSGHFQLADDGTLVTSQGYPVLAGSGPVTLPGEAELLVSPSGELRAGEQLLGNLRIAVFEGEPGFTHAGGGLLATDRQPASAGAGRVLQGVLEGANVEPVQALIEMIALTRHFEMNQKAFQAQDETLGALLSWVQG